jgi:hypothetical protein
VIVIGLEESESKRRRRRWGNAFVFLMSHAPGGLVIWWGIHIHLAGRFRTKMHWVVGEKAIAYSWGMIGIGVWALAYQGALFQNRLWLRWLGYLLAAGLVLYSFQRQFSK